MLSGFLSRDGITTFAEAANAVQTAYGFAYDISTVLSALGVIAGGDLATGYYSIGGADARVPNTLGPALGLDKHGRHRSTQLSRESSLVNDHILGTFEIDGSISREDNYFGNQANFHLSRFEALNATANEIGGGFGRDLFVQEKYTTYQTSRASNPEFNAGLKYFVVAHAERAFVFRGLPNGTNPDVPNYQNISPFFLDEEFPEDWFRRATPYTLANTVTDVLDLYTASPVELGANEGLNNFIPTGMDIPMEPQALACFLLGNIFDTVPGQVQPALLANIDLFEGFVDGVMAPLVLNAFGGCPGLTNYTVPSASAGTNVDGSLSAPGSPVDGVYPGTSPDRV